MNHKYNLEIVADTTYRDTKFSCNALIRMISFRDKRENHGDPDAYNDYFRSMPPDPMCYSKLNAYCEEDNRRYELRRQWKRDVLDTLGIQYGEVNHTGSEIFTAIEITEAEP